MNATVSRLKMQDEQGADGNEFVTFSINDELYAFEALHVQEIIELTTVTKVPHLPDYLKGVINLRGTIIPVVDLKRKFGMAVDGYRKHTCIIVTEFSRGVMGLIVDAVSDIIHLTEEAIAPPPSFGERINTDFIAGMVKVGDSLAILLHVDKVLSDEEASLVSSVAQSTALPEGQQRAATALEMSPDICI